MPTAYPLHTPLVPAGTLKDQALTASCQPGPGRGPTPAGATRGDYAVNTIQPPYQPDAPGTPVAKRLPPQTAPTIGEHLGDAGIDWAWYSGGWSNADGDVGAPGWTNGPASGGTCTDPDTASGAVFPNCPSRLFQYHHQPFSYYAAYAPGTSARAAHLRDEAEFLDLARSSTKACELRPVSFVRPIGAENEHPGHASESAGSDHLVDLLKAVESGACARHTMVVATSTSSVARGITSLRLGRARRPARTTSGAPGRASRPWSWPRISKAGLSWTARSTTPPRSSRRSSAASGSPRSAAATAPWPTSARSSAPSPHTGAPPSSPRHGGIPPSPGRMSHWRPLPPGTRRPRR